MAECFSCGISGNKVNLLDAISEKGIIKICKKCFSQEYMPLIKQPTNFQLQKAEKEQTIYERLSKASGIGRKEFKTKLTKTKEDVNLRYIVEKNLKTQAVLRSQGLIHNFHWFVMRGRRSKHLTKKQLGEAIKEPELKIKMIEQGIFPRNDYKLIKKIEDYLGIKITKGEIKEKTEEVKKVEITIPSQLKEISLTKKRNEEDKERILDFDISTIKNLTIDDLKKMKKKKEREILYPKKEQEKPRKEKRKYL